MDEQVFYPSTTSTEDKKNESSEHKLGGSKTISARVQDYRIYGLPRRAIQRNEADWQVGAGFALLPDGLR